MFNPIAFRMAKTQWSFGHSECNSVKLKGSLCLQQQQDNQNIHNFRQWPKA